jgi:predicted RNA-binding Zn ribbon-like protein
MSHYTEGAELATDLVNTFEVFGGEELLGSVDALAGFAAEHGIAGMDVTAEDLDRLRRARPVLRAAMLAGDAPRAVAALNDLLAGANPRPRMVPAGDGGWGFSYADPDAGLADRILAEAVAQVLHEIRGHGLERFATCASSTCEDVFVDRSRNRSRRYCTPEVCGNREAQRAYRARQRAGE